MKRRHDVINNRLRIGHTWLTHGHIMKKDEPVRCQTCGEALSVKRVLIYCRNYAETREQFSISKHLH